MGSKIIINGTTIEGDVSGGITIRNDETQATALDRPPRIRVVGGIGGFVGVGADVDLAIRNDLRAQS